MDDFMLDKDGIAIVTSMIPYSWTGDLFDLSSNQANFYCTESRNSENYDSHNYSIGAIITYRAQEHSWSVLDHNEIENKFSGTLGAYFITFDDYKGHIDLLPEDLPQNLQNEENELIDITFSIEYNAEEGKAYAKNIVRKET